jgi:hypothetical protein
LRKAECWRLATVEKITKYLAVVEEESYGVISET